MLLSSPARLRARGVGWMPRLLRTNRGSSKVSRSRPSVLDIAGCVIDSRSAALDTLPSSIRMCNATKRLRSIRESLLRFTLASYNADDWMRSKKYIGSNGTASASSLSGSEYVCAGSPLTRFDPGSDTASARLSEAGFFCAIFVAP
jgi:hypothetical protein